MKIRSKLQSFQIFQGINMTVSAMQLQLLQVYNCQIMKECPSKQDSIISLERLLTYHKRSTAFTFVDHQNSRVFIQEKPSIKSESAFPEDIMRNLWSVIDATYFGEITQQELDILNCIGKSEDKLNLYRYDEDFQGLIEGLFTQDYLRRDREGIQQELHRNWKEEIYIHWTFMMDDSQESLSSYQQFKNRRLAIKDVSLKNAVKKEQDLFASVKICEVNRPYEKQLAEVVLNNSSIVDRIFTQIHSQANFKYGSFKQSIGEVKSGEVDELIPTVQIAKREVERSILLKYLKYEIISLEKKQVADSISKVKSKKEGPFGKIYQLIFEEAMNLGSVEVTQTELKELNRLRQTSLFQFYQAGWKSKLNFICHNYIGFDILLTKPPQKAHLLTFASHLSYCMQQKQQRLSHEVEESFASVQSCHQCKLLYNRNILSKCQYIPTNKQDLNFPTFYDPYIYFLFKNDQKVGEIGAQLWENSILSNPYRNASNRSCGRLFCKMCVKDQSNFKCRFCQGTCVCSRCIRNTTIAKLKTVFSLLGGDSVSLQRQSYFSKICHRPNNQEPKNSQCNSVRGEKQVKQETLASYKMQLEELRLLAHMVMRREVIKLQQFINQEEILKEKMRLNKD